MRHRSACAEYGLSDQAIQYFTRTLEVDPGYDTSMRNIGKVYLQAGQYDKALLQFEALVKKNKNDVEAVRFSAECLSKIGWADDAIARYKYLLLLTPKDAETFRQLGYLYRDQKNEPAKAQDYFIQSLSINPDQPDVKAIVSTDSNKNEIAAQKDDLPLPKLPPMPDIPNIPHIPMPSMPEIPQPPQPGNSLMP